MPIIPEATPENCIITYHSVIMKHCVSHNVIIDPLCCACSIIIIMWHTSTGMHAHTEFNMSVHELHACNSEHYKVSNALLVAI